MARAIVILALMFLIASLIFAVTKKPSGASITLNADARTTVPLVDLPEDVKDTVAKSILADEETAEAASAQEVMSGTVSGAAPAVVTVGLDHKGRASFTGTATPGDEVTIARDGKAMGKGTADQTGNWAIGFKVGPVREDFDLHISAKGKNGKIVEGPRRAFVSPPENSGGLARISLMPAELKVAETAPPESGEPEIGLIVEKVTGQSDGGTAVLNGKADPGATIKAELNERSAGEAKVDASGHWSLAVRNNSSKDSAAVKLRLYSAKGQVIDEADVPYKIEAMKVAEVVPTQASSGGEIVKVRRGDNLWKIAKRRYGDGRKWKTIYKANKAKIGDPDLIYAGRSLWLPD